MNQQEFKEAIFENRQNIKDKLTHIYDSKKLIKTFLVVFEKIDFLTFCKLSQSEQKQLLNSAFAPPELVFGKTARDEIATTNKIATKRYKSKK
jgi:hypothetical protein